MLKKHIRVLVAAFLMAAIPLQGYAALGASTCRDLQHSQHDAGHGHMPTAVVAQAHDHGSHGDAHAASVDEDSALPDSASAHCAACASCGVVAGITAASVSSHPVALGRDLIVHTAPASVGFVPDTRNRPPLTPFA